MTYNDVPWFHCKKLMAKKGINSRLQPIKTEFSLFGMIAYFQYANIRHHATLS